MGRAREGGGELGAKVTYAQSMAQGLPYVMPSTPHTGLNSVVQIHNVQSPLKSISTPLKKKKGIIAISEGTIGKESNE